MHSGGNPVSQYSACIFGTGATTLSDEERDFFRDVRPFGFILFARNVDTPDQLRRLTDDLRDAAGHNAPILIDQEGGRVQRLKGPVWREWLPPLDQVKAAGSKASEAMYARYRIIAHELHALGIDSNCAPLVDVASAKTHLFLKNRCYGENPEAVAKLGHSVAQGLLDGGVLPVVKHIPGHGRAMCDSHLELPRVDAALEELRDIDFAPFRVLNHLPMGMTAHIAFSAIDTSPATLSKPVMDVIRNDIGFDGLIMTDDISMQALEGDLAGLSRRALEAGCDVILHCNGKLEEAKSIADEVGFLSEAGHQRAERALAARQTPNEVDIPALEAKLAQLLNG